MTTKRVAARTLVGLVGAMTAGGALAADALVPTTARQHLRNPRWPGHAKFHDAQYIVMSMLLGGAALGLVTTGRGDPDRNLLAAAALSSTPWLGMYGAAAFPGTELVDEEFDTPKVLGLDPNIAIATTCLAALGAAVGLARSGR